jgi:hypothetical protein
VDRYIFSNLILTPSGLSLRIYACPAGRRHEPRAGSAVGSNMPPGSASSPESTMVRKRPHEASAGHALADAADGKKKMNKVTRACDVCKSRKARCSGTQPCESCVNKSLPCSFNASYSRGRAPTPPPGPASAGSLDTSSPGAGMDHSVGTMNYRCVPKPCQFAGACPQCETPPQHRARGSPAQLCTATVQS